jgi:hypothetical protein
MVYCCNNAYFKTPWENSFLPMFEGGGVLLIPLCNQDSAIKKKEKKGLTRRRGGRGERVKLTEGKLIILKTAVDIASTFIFYPFF